MVVRCLPLFAICVAYSLFAMSPRSTFAHDYSAPATVQADAAGCFTFETLFLAVDFDVMLDSEFVDGTDNTSLDSDSTSFGCTTTIPSGSNDNREYAGCLLDPALGGTVEITLTTCASEVFEVSVSILPCDIPAIPAVPPYIFADDNGAFFYPASYTITCTGQRLGTMDWLPQSNISGSAIFLDWLCFEAFEVGLVLGGEFQGNLTDPSQVGTATLKILRCNESSLCYDVLIFPPPSEEFLRGDANNDGVVTALPDALFLLNYGFTDGATPNCWAAADADSSGSLAPLNDALYLLTWGFGGGAAPAAPFPTCGASNSSVLPCVSPICAP